MVGRSEGAKAKLAEWAASPSDRLGPVEFGVLSVAAGVALAISIWALLGDEAVDFVLEAVFDGLGLPVSTGIMSLLGIAGPIILGFVGMAACIKILEDRNGGRGFGKCEVLLPAGVMAASSALYFLVVPIAVIVLAFCAFLAVVYFAIAGAD